MVIEAAEHDLPPVGRILQFVTGSVKIIPLFGYGKYAHPQLIFTDRSASSFPYKFLVHPLLSAGPGLNHATNGAWPNRSHSS